eukprot:gnl/TRDRNA2_/TRDRNA2_168802_c2_seq1.p1 gnl/TRDRNA2_/TRDRNA2_168802_c2~~gnl/TRDRNA2_/TRDRNA2_168802_c2_seq1.p1  ORF type:complete len:673 (-),score=181.71 gnl/TRDRNA2_/TRDRNA2_168802_c2_seq1:82-2100(-)
MRLDQECQINLTMTCTETSESIFFLASCCATISFRDAIHASSGYTSSAFSTVSSTISSTGLGVRGPEPSAPSAAAAAAAAEEADAAEEAAAAAAKAAKDAADAVERAGTEAQELDMPEEGLGLEEVEADDADGADQDAEEQPEHGPVISIYKPVSPYEVQWEIMEEQGADVTKKGVKQGKKKKAVKGRCAWRNPVGYLGSCDLMGGGHHTAPYPNDIYAVYTTVQGGDSKELLWVDGVTALSAECDNLIAFVLLITFLRSHQELSFDMDAQEGRILAIHSLNGMDFTLNQDQVLLVEDVAKIQAVRSAMSEAFFCGETRKLQSNEDGINFWGGKREAEEVPQLSVESKVPEALKDLIDTLREAAQRNTTMSEATWNSRIFLRKPARRLVDMHQEAKAAKRALAARGGNLRNAEFKLFEPITDLMAVKKEAEEEQRREDERRRIQEEEKRRKKEEERRQREEEKRQKKYEEQRRKEEMMALKRAEALAAKGRGKGKRGQAQAEAMPQRNMKGGWQDQWNMPYQQQQGQQQNPKGQKEKQGKKQQQQQQQMQPGPQAHPKRGAKAQKDAGAEGDASWGNFSLDPAALLQRGPLPPPWAAVTDPNTGRPYYWNQVTNEVSWTPPQMPIPTRTPQSQGPQTPGPIATSSDAWGPEFGRYGGAFLPPGGYGVGPGWQ